MGRGKRDTNPMVLKIGLALAFSLGGMLCTFIRNKRIKPSQSSSDPSKSSGKESHITPKSCQFDPLKNDKHEELPNSNAEKDPYLLPEFHDLVKEFDMTAMKTNTELPRVVKDGHEQEIKSLRNMVKTLKERERNLEIQLLEYCGLKEQETAVMELQNRLKLNNMEAKLLALKIESFQTDNKRLEAQMTDYTEVLAELEAARATIKILKKKLRSEAEQNKEQILNLQQRVQKMQEDEHMGVAQIDPEIQLNLSKLKDLEGEFEELEKSNYNLQIEKSELAQRLEHAQILMKSVLEDEKTEKLKEESRCLKKQNEDLTKEIEQLQAERCSDVEELVYLRWINACLRYELRNYQPGPGKMMACDLSKTLSPKSEEKAKQLILKYANKEDMTEKEINIQELNFYQSSSEASSELDESLIDDPLPHKTNNKFFRKLVKLLRGKDNHSPLHHHHHHHDRHGHHRQHSHSRNSSLDDMNFRNDLFSGHLVSSSKYSMDSQRFNHRHSDVGVHKRIDSIAEGSDTSSSSSGGKKSELLKYADVLKDSNLKSKTKRSALFGSF